jgi:hypothetical protein
MFAIANGKRPALSVDTSHAEVNVIGPLVGRD